MYMCMLTHKRSPHCTVTVLQKSIVCEWGVGTSLSARSPCPRPLGKGEYRETSAGLGKEAG